MGSNPDNPDSVKRSEAATVADAGDIATIPDGSGPLPPLPDEGYEIVSRVEDKRYKIRGLLGCGGQARILLAFDEHLEREVAIKEMLLEDSDWAEEPTPASTPSPTPSPSSRPRLAQTSRFLREARVTGQLEHPNIVPVHELVRQKDGSLYYTMRLVRGKTLAAKMRECKSLGERLKLLGAFWNVCNAIAFAHSKGVVHRDIKPQNVMLGEFGETVVLDWGVAKVKGQQDFQAKDLEKAAQQLNQPQEEWETAVGTVLGTPAYMSPEQACGDVDEIDERSDVWGLGAMLYAILTGGPPYHGDTSDAAIQMVANEPWVPVRSRCAEAPAELAEVAQKALQRDKSQRYQSARELAEEIDAYMTGGRVRAHEYGSWELLKRFVAKNKAAVLACSAILVAILVSLVLVAVAYQEESQARGREHRERLMARYHLAQAFAEQAARLAEEKKLLSSRIYAAASLAENPANRAGSTFDGDFARLVPESARLEVDAGSLVYRTAHRLVNGQARIWAMDENVSSLAFDPFGRLLAVSDHAGMLSVFDVAGPGESWRIKAHLDVIGTVAFSRDGWRLATASRDQTVKIWKVANGEPLRTLGGEEKFISVAFSPDGRWIAAGAENGLIRVWEIESGRELWNGRHEDQVWGLQFSPDGKYLASGSWDKTAVLWKAADGTRLRTMKCGDGVNRVSFSPNGRSLATASDDKIVRLWNVPAGTLQGALEGHAEVVEAVWSDDGRRLASADKDGTAALWDVASHAPLFRLDTSLLPINAVALSPDGRFLATGGHDRRVRLWHLNQDDGLRRLPHEDWVFGVAFSRDGRLAVTGSWDKTVRVWDLGSMQLLRSLVGHQDGLMAVDISPDGRRAVSASFDQTARLWDVQSGETLATLLGHQDALYEARFSPDGCLVATTGKDHTVRLWDGETGWPLAVFTESTKVINQLAFSPDGRLLAAPSRDQKVRVWDVAERRLVATLEGHRDWVSGAAFSPDGRLLASAGKDAVVILWDTRTWQPVQRLVGDRQWIFRVEFSPDGRFLTSVGHSTQAVVWEVKTGRPRLFLRATGGINASAFSPDGRWLALSDYPEAVLYPLDLDAPATNPMELLQEAQRQAGLTLKGFDLVPLEDTFP